MAEPALRDFAAAELDQAVDPRVSGMAQALAAEYSGSAQAVLFYGSCLRERQLEGLMVDFYLIVSDYRSAYPRRWLAAANRLIPPNVFPFQHEGLTAKYAVLSEADFERECGVGARSVSVWARFAQPSRLVWARDAEARERAIGVVAEAGPTLFALTRPVMWGDSRHDPLSVFRAGFGLTYGAELRAERKERPGSIVDADPERYRVLGRLILEARPEDEAAPKGARAMRGWRIRQWKGKGLTVLRLVKASATFAGGIDYLVWKINRHAGTQIVLKPWQRRWPLAAAFTLLPRLLKRGAIR